MKTLITFLRQQQRYYVLYLTIAFVLFTVVWFLTSSVPEYGVSKSASAAVSNTSASSNSDFVPDATNVSQTATRQLDALRLRVVNAPEDTTHIYRLARMLQDGHQIEEASRNYKHYLALHPQNRQAWLDFAQCLGKLKSWSEAEKAALDMLERYPEDPAGLYNLGAIYANQSKVEEAQEVWDKVARQQESSEMATMAIASLQRLKSFVKPQWVASE